jgi:hypothetical protein
MSIYDSFDCHKWIVLQDICRVKRDAATKGIFDSQNGQIALAEIVGHCTAA